MVIVSLVIESSLIKIVPFYHTYSDIGTRVLVFVIIYTILIMGETIILIDIFRSGITSRHRIGFDIIRKSLYICQIAISSVLTLIIIEVIVMSRVSTFLLTISATIGYTLSSVIFAVLAYHFFQWYLANRNNVVLSYGICCTALTLNLVISIIFVDILLQQRQEVLLPQLGLSDKFITNDPMMRTLQVSYVVSSILGFTAAWASSVILLYHYSSRKGSIKSWTLLSIPLILFISQYIGTLFNLFPAMVGQNPVFFGNILTIVYAVSRPAGGILFGLALWIISRYIKENNAVRGYLIRSAYGFILFFVSNQAIVLITTNYPPFGVMTTAFLPIASFLVFAGIYSIAVSVSQDISLRRSIKNSVEKEVLFVDSIAMAQMNKQIQHKVLRTIRNLSSEINEATGIENSLTDEDIKMYINEALRANLSKKASQR